MYTKAQLLQSIPDVPVVFSIEELEALLSRPHPAVTAVSAVAPPRPANLLPKEAAEWDYYTSPEALALYAELAAKFPASTTVERLHGLVQLAEADERKSAKEWRAAAVQEKYGL